MIARDYARAWDAIDPLAHFRERFHLPADGRIYMDGNSLGLMSRGAEGAALGALDQWKTLGIDGWLEADPDWFTLAPGSPPSALVATTTAPQGERCRP